MIEDVRFELDRLADEEEALLRRVVARVDAVQVLRDLAWKAGAEREDVTLADLDDVARVLAPLDRARWDNAVAAFVANDEEAEHTDPE